MYYVEPNRSLARAYLLMKYYQLDHLPVLDNTEVLGAITKSDIYRALESKESSREVHCYMNKNVLEVSSNLLLGDVFNYFFEYPVDVLILKKGDQFIRSVSRNDLIRKLIDTSHQKATMLKQQLVQFIDLKENNNENNTNYS